MSSKDPTEKKLAALRDLVRGSSEREAVFTRAVPAELAREGAEQISLSRPELERLRAMQEALSTDPRFEHLDRGGEAELVEFLARILLKAPGDPVARFIEENSRTPESRTCYFPVEFLSLGEPTTLAGISLIPMIEGEPEKLKISVGPRIKTVAAVAVSGTNLDRMAERAREAVEHALRVLRISLREDRMVHAYQLRFRLADHYAFDLGGGGWKAKANVGFELELDPQLLQVARSAPFRGAPLSPGTKLERRVDRAMRWIEQAFLVGDELHELLFYFFALEALLGDESGGLKSHRLAFRRALLGSVTRERFAHPNQVALLYDEVRSAAVHGSEAPKVAAKTLASFAWDTRLALVEYVEYAQAEGFGRQGKLIAGLEADPRQELLIKGLRETEPELWGPFLDDLEEERRSGGVGERPDPAEPEPTGEGSGT